MIYRGNSSKTNFGKRYEFAWNILYTKGTEGNPSQELREMLKYVEGTNQINALNVKLAENGRVDDIVKSSANQEYQKQLLKEFGLLQSESM